MTVKNQSNSGRKWVLLSRNSLQRMGGIFFLGALLVVLSDCISVQTSEAALPVLDMAAVGQMIQQYEQMTAQLETMYQQVDLLKTQIQTLTGHYGYASVVSAVNPWGTSSWQDIANMVSQGVNPGDAAQVAAYAKDRAAYQTTYPVLAQNLVSQNPRMGAVYSGNYQAAMTGYGLSEQTFDAIQGHLTELQALKDRIEQTDNIKAAMDLNTTVNIKTAELVAELLRMNAVQLHMHAGSANDSTSGQAAQAEFFTN